MTISVTSIRHNTRRIVDVMNDRAVQRIVEAYMRSILRRMHCDDQKDTELERKRQ